MKHRVSGTALLLTSLFGSLLPTGSALAAVKVSTHREISGKKIRAYVPAGADVQLSIARPKAGAIAAFSAISGRETAIFVSQLDGDKWSDPARVSPPGQIGFSPRLLEDPPGNLHCVWLVKLLREGRMFEIFHSSKKKDAESWSVPQALGRSAEHETAQIGADGRGSLYVWFSSRESRRSPRKVRLLQSQDGGDSWQELAPFGNETPSSQSSLELHVSPEGRIVALWLDRSVGRESVLLNVSEDSGRTWFEQPVVINERLDLEASSPFLFVAEEGIFVFWKFAFLGAKMELWVDFSGDGGKTWAGDHLAYEGKQTYRLDAVPYRAHGQVGALWSERQGVDTWTVKQRACWAKGSWVGDPPERVLLEAAKSYKLGGINWGWRENDTLAVVAENFGAASGKVWLFYPSADSGWTSLQVDRKAQLANTRDPVVLAGEETGDVRVFYYESGNPRFAGDPWKPEAILLETVLENVVQ